MTGQRWNSSDYKPIDGVLVHKRWLNDDGTRKDGIELEKEQVRVELEDIAARLRLLSRLV